MKAKVSQKRKEKVLDVQVVNLYIRCTFNNIMLSIISQTGGVLFQTSSGANSFKGPKKSTPYAAQVIAEKARSWLLSHGVKALSIKLNGPHNTRDSAIKILTNNNFGERVNGYVITSISDITPIPHNGCRPRKIRKV